MSELPEPLSHDDMASLDAVLMNRLAGKNTHGKNEGIRNLHILDGFLTAVVSGPSTIMPAQWLPVVWGDFDPAWESAEARQAFMDLTLRHMNHIARMLDNDPKHFAPLFRQREVEGQNVVVVDEWCYGYLIGMELDRHGWEQTQKDLLHDLLQALSLFATPQGWAVLEKKSDDEIDRLQAMVTPIVRDTYAYWRQQRTESQLPLN